MERCTDELGVLHGACVSGNRHIGKVKICLDAAASEFFVEENMYDLGYKMALNDGSGQLLGEQLGAEYERLCTLYPVVSIEDPFEADDFINTKDFAARALCQVTKHQQTPLNTRHGARWIRCELLTGAGIFLACRGFPGLAFDNSSARCARWRATRCC